MELFYQLVLNNGNLAPLAPLPPLIAKDFLPSFLFLGPAGFAKDGGRKKESGTVA